MAIRLAALLGVALFLCLPSAVWADIPPSPPLGLRATPGIRPLPVVIAGIAVALALAVCGLVAARHRARPGILVAALVGAVVVLAAAGAVAIRADREANEQAALRAEYEKSLANWRPRGPVRLPPPREVPAVVAIFAVGPQGSFPHNLPWAALALSGTGGNPDTRLSSPVPDPEPIAAPRQGEEQERKGPDGR
jgi:hypothetical protein